MVQRWNEFITVLAAAAAVPTAPSKVPPASSYGLKASLVLRIDHMLSRDAAAMSDAVWSELLQHKVSKSSAGMHQHGVPAQACTQCLLSEVSATYLLGLMPY